MREFYDVASLLAMISMAVALFSLKRDYECFRKDIVRIVGGLGIVCKNSAEGTTIHITERICKADEGMDKEQH
ncbi:MAG: hypothetical protein IJI83_03270 [Oscillospiraceae bacterium]|nr:hypothetical protein [Oscillospiraceae bacterium]